ncbi:radical SAM protein with 4Fe4S-binding SPASM domain [Paenibacillus forsythiae]|uniref:Radical SAM protein with 4Fe4S-binding SPASM domain n=1 Tax=Paenibacillus forsythiae TaxID=365616 RepID=A0ABU3H6L7_9BACL|nr:radical SAM/SPASM domain-containing protein [Paenibacillus forsythiae]MDT3426464.1 radical SAM protein with 4Fe4S-binding SPASM domain [Paenibacillus forsythiae]
MNMITQESLSDYSLKIAGLYPKVNDTTYVHKMPDRNYIHGDYDGEEVRFIFQSRTMNTINDDALSLLELCDGTRTTEEIIRAVNQHYNSGDEAVDFSQDVISFLYISTEIFKNVTIQERIAETPAVLQITGAKDKYFPQHFAMEVTTKCNLTCKHCYRSSSPSITENEIPLDKVLSTLQEMYDVGGRFVEITGGEPFIHSGIKEILKYAADKFNFVAILTNGTMVTPQIMDFLEPYKDKVIWSISLDSCKEEYHDQFRGLKGAFKRTTNTIKQLTDRGFTVRTSMTMTLDNLDHFIDTLNFVKDDLKSTFFGYSYVLNYGRGKEIPFHPNPAQVQEMLAIDKYTEKEELSFFVNKVSAERSNQLKKTMINCGAGWRTIAIGPNGNVRPCVMMDESFITLGNIYDNKINEIMDEQITPFFHNIRWPLEAECTGCGNEQYCKWCTYRAMIINVERVRQGIGLCKWAKNNRVDQFFDFERLTETGAPTSSLDALHCGDMNCSVFD